ncbi:MAG: peptide ABC transporter substrate-binding protein, partial [Chloroflexota bacterium]|nr:peptide ABC transporter substrate-binding protein [Chloroflexota bacterium]
MKRTWLYPVLAVIVVTAVLLTSCQPTPAPTSPPKATEPPSKAPTPTPPSPTALPAERKITTLIFTQEPAMLNPLYSNMWFELILAQLWSCWAWEFDNQNEAFPRLVTELPSMENGGVSEDGLTITMHLRDDVVWSDGTPITSADFVFTYDMYMDPGNSVATQYPYDSLESIEAPDERTVVMHFTEPFAAWQALFWRGVLPKHVLGPVFEADGSIDQAAWNLAPTVGCGPFNFAEWESGSFMRFAKNENYWLGQPNLDEIFVRFVPDDASQTAALVAGDGDLGTFPPLSDVPALQDAGLQIVVQPSGYQEGWFFNFRDMANPAARDVKVRQAIAMAIDRDAINRDLLLGLTKAPETYWDSLPAYRAPDIEPWKYDPQEAERLLEEAGWTDRDGDGIREDVDGNKLTLIYGTTIREIRQDAQAVAQQQLKEVGIDLQLMSQDADIFFGSYADGAAPALGEVDIMEWSDGPYFPDPDTDYWLCSQVPSDENPTGYNYFGCDEPLDGLFTRQLTTMNVEEREKIFHEISRYMHEQVYWLGMWEDPDYWVVG